MAELLGRVVRIAPSRLPVLITGETGTGKLTLARAIHSVSGRGPFMALSCADLADTAAEALLFGRQSARDGGGLLSQLAGGTLVLQNVEDLPGHLQPRLSRLLAEGAYVPLGGLRPVEVDLRVIATSQHEQPDRVLRADFYHRLSGAVVNLPPLRQRQDLLWLARGLIQSAARRRLEIAPEILRAIAQHGWPGNLRELQFLARRLALEATGGRLVSDPSVIGLVPAAPDADTSTEALLLSRMLRETKGNISACARQLGVDRTTVHRRLKRFGLRH